MINFYWWNVLGLWVCLKKSATMYQYWIFIWRQIFAFKCADLHFSMIVGFVQAHKLFARSIVGSHKCSIWGDIKQSTKLRLFLPSAAEKDRTMRRRRRRNNNVTQRFIECNKRNKYPRSFLVRWNQKFYLRLQRAGNSHCEMHKSWSPIWGAAASGAIDCIWAF